MRFQKKSRYWLPILAGLATVFAALFLRQQLLSHEHADINSMTQSQALFARSKIEAQVTSRILVLSRLASRWEVWGKPDQSDWESDATLLMSGYLGYQAIEWVDPSFHTRWIAPLSGNEADQNLDFASDVRRRNALNTALDMHDVFVTRPIDLRQGGQGFLVCVPIFSGTEFSGFIVGVFRYQDLMKQVLESVSNDYDVALFDGDQQVYARSASNLPRVVKWSQRENVNLGSRTWQVSVWPEPETLARVISPLPFITLLMGLFVAILLAALVYSAQTSAFHAHEVVVSNDALKKEIAERMEAEEQLRQAQKMEAVGRLAGGIAHDFNNLLMIIRGHALLSLQTFVPRTPVRKNLEDILTAVDRASSLTRKLLAFSRKQVLQPKVIDLNALVIQAEELLLPILGEDIELALFLEPRLRHIKADPGQIEQVLVNLVVNARDAMPRGGRLTIQTAGVDLTCASARHPDLKPGTYVMLSVKDTGHGMDAETLSHVFEPFFSTKEINKGTGLGLSTVYGIVQQSGGTIAVTSVPEQGTSVAIYFPPTDEPLKETETPKPQIDRVEGTETVLVVEDDDAVRKMSCTFLSTKGYAVLEAASAAEAIRIADANSKSIDLVLTDLVMPGMKGRELAECIAKAHPGIPVLYMSAYTEDAVLNTGVLDPGTAFIEKPFGPDELAAKVRELLKASGKQARANLSASNKL